MKTYLVYLLLCNTVCTPLSLVSVSGAHNAEQAARKAIELATDCTTTESMCAQGLVKADRVELQHDAPKLHY